MAEQLANNASSTLNGGITNVATSLTVVNGTLYPATGNFRIRIDSELILVGARSGNTLSSLTRGIEGTTGAAHNSGSDVPQVVTVGGLLQYLAETTSPVATTVAGLPSSIGGTRGTLRIGSSPYDVIGLVYDATIAKWVSQPIMILPFFAAGRTVAATTYTLLTGLTEIPDLGSFKRIYDAGLRPQMKFTVIVQGSSGTVNSRFGIDLREWNNGDTTPTGLGTGTDSITFDSGDISTPSANAIHHCTDWLTATMSAPTKSHAEAYVMGRIASGTLTVHRPAVELRWVSA